MKARLLPVYFRETPDQEYTSQVAILCNLLKDVAEILDPAPLGSTYPDADAVLFPQILGDAYRRIDELRAIDKPLLIATSEFGTVSMWDWEVAAYLRSAGIRPLVPYQLEQAKKICRALQVRRKLRSAKFLVFQDNPGEGFQADIFKRFYWWEDECTQRILQRFGVQIERKSFRELGAMAREIPDSDAQESLQMRNIATSNVTEKSLRSAAKLYLAIKHYLDGDNAIQAIGINCLNESHFSDTTPCLAWSLLYEEQKLIWGCEGDTLSMLTKHLLHKSLEAPIMMTNLYPFLLGQAALKHERISAFPDIPESHNCVLVAHCGYLGVLPTSFATEWTLKPKVLRIVNENATAIDARLPEGPITLAKLSPALDRISVAEGMLEGYTQYPGSDCLNGGILRFKDGHKLMQSISSHHYLLMTGHRLADIEMISSIFDLSVDVI